MPRSKQPKVIVPEGSEKHLARNIPTNWSEYCQQIRSREFPRGIPPRGHTSHVLVRRHQPMVEICFPKFDEPDQEIVAFADKLYDISVRHQALLITVDQTVSPKPVFETLKNLRRSTVGAIRALEDDTRDQVVADLSGYDSAGDIPGSKAAFEGAASLAEKVSITRRVLENQLSQIDFLADHFDYKSRRASQGKPSTYAFPFAVFSLAEVFEEHDQRGRKANVNERIADSDDDWGGNYQYSGPFLDFVTSFFTTYDPGSPLNEGRFSHRSTF